MLAEQMRMLAFAQQHTWGDTAQLVEGGALRVSTIVLEDDGHVEREYFVAHSMLELRNWAGY